MSFLEKNDLTVSSKKKLFRMLISLVILSLNLKRRFVQCFGCGSIVFLTCTRIHTKTENLFSEGEKKKTCALSFCNFDLVIGLNL